MKKSVKIILIVLAVILAGSAWVYWQYNKKQIIRNKVESLILKKSDSLYYIHYDSSFIDAANGNASFYNISLQSDSLQQQLMKYDTASNKTIYNVRVAEVSISGVNIPGLLSNEKIEAGIIRIIRPVIYIISAGKYEEEEITKKDSLALYEKVLGKFKSIKAGQVIIEDGQINFTKRIDTPFAMISGIRININNVRIDSTRDYDNLVSYFIKGAELHVKKAVIDEDDSPFKLTFTDLDYKSREKILSLGNFKQENKNTGKRIFDINNSSITGLNTDSFILRNQLKATELVSDGGLMTFYRKKNPTEKHEKIEMDNSFFDEAQLNKITLKDTRVVIYKADRLADPPIVIEKVKFIADEIQSVHSGTNIRNLVGLSNWELSADGFSLLSADRIYKIAMGPFHLKSKSGKMHINHFSVLPQVSEAAFVKGLKEQKDLYSVRLQNIDVEGLDVKALISNREFLARDIRFQPEIKIFSDRTIPAFTGSKLGNYPHQIIQKLDVNIYVRTIHAKNGYVSYTERGEQSEKKGTVFFSNIQGTIENVTNIQEKLRTNNNIVLNAGAKFLGKPHLQTKWILPADTRTGAFTIVGYISGFDATLLNSLIEPLALASIKHGYIKSLDFSMQGNDSAAGGKSTLLYDNLKIEAVKLDSVDYKKRDLVSFMANLLVKNSNPRNGKTRQGDIDIERDNTRSFFNLIWKGIFKAAKRTALGKDDK